MVDDSDRPSQPVHDEVTLGEILTVLDGTMETPGRLVIMTSNHPELLDEALIRPGRIDVMVKFDKASAHTISQMFQAFYDTEMSRQQIEALPDKELTPAEVGQVLFKHFDDTDSSRVISVMEDLQQTSREHKTTREARQDAQKEELVRREKKKKDERRSNRTRKSRPKKKSALKTSQLVRIDQIPAGCPSSSEESISSYSESDEISDVLPSPQVRLPQAPRTTDEKWHEESKHLGPQERNILTEGAHPQAFNDGFSSLDDMYAPLSEGISVR
jgi:SpoVK/Ycf46/Vps4 family AAA+-type ATPase